MELTKYAVMDGQSLLEDVDLAMDARLRPVDDLKRLMSHQVELMRAQVERKDVAGFTKVWDTWVQWARHWNPEDVVEDLELQERIVSGEQKTRVRWALEDARRVVDAKRELEAHRAWMFFQLGAWFGLLHLRGELSDDSWRQLVPYVAGPYSGDAQLSPMLIRATGAAPSVLENWEMREPRTATTWGVDMRLVGGKWAAVLLARAAARDGSLDLDFGSAAQAVGDALRRQLSSVREEGLKWADVIEADVARATAAAEQVVGVTVERQQGAQAAAVAAAELDPERVSDFAAAVRKRYENEVVLRDVFSRAGRLQVESDPHTGPAPGAVGFLWPRSVFVPGQSQTLAIGWERPGADLAREDGETVYTELAAVATAQTDVDDVARAAVAAIDSLRSAGREPDVVLLPRNVRARALLAQHPHFEWTSDFLKQTKHMGTLAGVPVFDAGPLDATTLVVADLGAALDRVELRRELDDSGIWVEVRSIDEERARQLVESSGADNSPETVGELISTRVEVFVGLSVRYQSRPGAGAAIAVPLPVDVLEGKRSPLSDAPAPPPTNES